MVEEILKNQSFSEHIKALKTPSRRDFVGATPNSKLKSMQGRVLLRKQYIASSTKASEGVPQTPIKLEPQEDRSCLEDNETGKGGLFNEKPQIQLNLGPKSKKISKNLQVYQINCRSYGPWNEKEDQAILKLVKEHGFRWERISNCIGRTRSGKQIRERYLNKLAPNVAHVPWTPEEDAQLLELFNQHGRKWSKIAKCIPGRSEVMVKNRFHHRYKQLVIWNKGNPQNQGEFELKNWQYKRKALSQRVSQIMQNMNRCRLKHIALSENSENTSTNPHKKLKQSLDPRNSTEELNFSHNQNHPQKINLFTSEVLSQKYPNSISQALFLKPFQRGLSLNVDDEAELREKPNFQTNKENFVMDLKQEFTEEINEEDNKIKIKKPELNGQDSSLVNLKIEEDFPHMTPFLNENGTLDQRQKVYRTETSFPLEAEASNTIEDPRKRLENLRSDIPKLELLYFQSLQALMKCLNPKTL